MVHTDAIKVDPEEALYRLEKGEGTKNDQVFLAIEYRKMQAAFSSLTTEEQNIVRLKMLRDDPYAKPSEVSRVIKQIEEMESRKKKERKESGADAKPLKVEVPKMAEVLRLKNG